MGQGTHTQIKGMMSTQERIDMMFGPAINKIHKIEKALGVPKSKQFKLNQGEPNKRSLEQARNLLN